jgi:uncharacterized protein DUF1549/uncharacterized protein DUF1553/cytochrome c
MGCDLTLRIQVAAALAVLGSLARASEVEPSRLPAPAARTVDFQKDVQPILAHTCYPCHGARKQKSGYRLDRKAEALKGGDRGPAILPGRSADSALILYVSGHGEIRMPPNGKGLTAEEVGILRAWIDQGADWPRAAEATPVEKPHWSLEPLVKPPLPEIKDRGWIRTPIDAFILARLEAAGMSPSPPTDRRTLIRRVTYDLTGLPPTPAEVAAFLDDAAPDAYEKVVDRLLASPRYGERWARHWMDVVHYAETHGNDEDKPRPNAWPYRDYLIQSFNQDKPYRRFIEEQLAGDVLYPADPQATVATAFIAVGPWDQSSQMGIQDGTLDKQAARYLDRDDMIATTISTFDSATVHCARCHDHKFDPIPQEDYYALQAVFAGVDRIDRPYDPDPEVHAARRALLARKAELEDDAKLAAALRDPATAARIARWEEEQKEWARAWTVLEPKSVASAGGSKLAKLPDGSILASGPPPDKDTYTITAVTGLEGITAVRLELLTDESLPKHGPGRQPENGNVHISEIKLTCAPEKTPGVPQPAAFREARADFDQDGFGVSKAIDGQAETSWAIHPEEGKPHVAVLALKDPIGCYGGTVLTFALDQLQGRGHLIGRMRLSVTTAPAPPDVLSMPDGLRAITALPLVERSGKQTAELARYVLRLELDRRLAALPAPHFIYAVASDFEPRGNFKPAKNPRPVAVLRRGDIRQPIGPAAPGALSCVGGLEARFALADPQDEGARRAALARWIAHRENRLTWRSIVNRAWHYHFGRGLVDTPNDLGRMGGTPSHPELIDFLAVTFRDEMDGSLKKLDRLLVTSSAYRQSSLPNERFAGLDAENRLLWRMNRARLDAEQVRDALLSISGQIDWTMGGPSVKQFVETKGTHETPVVDYAGFDVDSPASRRRSVYRFVFRTIPDPLLQTLDCPDASQLAPARQVSINALQALALLNDRFVVHQSERIAERLSGIDRHPEKQVEALYLAALGRPPEPAETDELLEYASKHGLANACRMVLNSNEFLFIP